VILAVILWTVSSFPLFGPGGGGWKAVDVFATHAECMTALRKQRDQFATMTEVAATGDTWVKGRRIHRYDPSTARHTYEAGMTAWKCEDTRR
jgi:hypothetical protein